jgi:hypothetical protein
MQGIADTATKSDSRCKGTCHTTSVSGVLVNNIPAPSSVRSSSLTMSASVCTPLDRILQLHEISVVALGVVVITCARGCVQWSCGGCDGREANELRMWSCCDFHPFAASTQPTHNHAMEGRRSRKRPLEHTEPSM